MRRADEKLSTKQSYPPLPLGPPFPPPGPPSPPPELNSFQSPKGRDRPPVRLVLLQGLVTLVCSFLLTTLDVAILAG